MATYVLVHGAYQGGWIYTPEAHQRRTAERLRATWHEVDTGHYPMLSEPAELARLLLVEAG